MSWNSVILLFSPFILISKEIITEFGINLFFKNRLFRQSSTKNIVKKDTEYLFQSTHIDVHFLYIHDNP